jgi:hypothetical protein
MPLDERRDEELVNSGERRERERERERKESGASSA